MEIIVANIQDVAKRAKVSIATVSRVLNDSKHKVRPQTRARVLAAVRKLDYRPNALARGLQMKRTMTIGVIIPDISNPYYAEIVRGIQDVADEKGYNILLQNTDRKQERIIKSIHLLREKIVDGVIFSGGIIHENATLSALNELRERVVVIGRHEVNFPAALVDNIGGAAEAIQHLIDLGHRKIAFIGGPKNSATMIDRLKGYESALARNGCPLKKNRLKWGDLTPESGYTVATALLSQKDRPTAIFASNDMMAFGSLHAARKLGLTVPDDVAVVGFDDVALCAFVQPALTTVQIPRYGIGVGAMQMLIDLISGNTFDRIQWFKTRLMPRESTLKQTLTQNAE
ncbi:MAG: LacI family DNA-binding transcriptional regulator [Desulfobacterales bacterium]|jgi:LacI family transcriptional regulator